MGSVQDADQIVVLDDGGVHAVGTHEELLATDSIYQEIYASQTRGGDTSAPGDKKVSDTKLSPGASFDREGGAR